MERYFLGRASLERVEKPSRWRAAERQRIRKAKEFASKTIDRGAEQIADAELRIAYAEMSKRLLENGPHVMPLQFNVFEAFISVDEKLGVYRLLPEHDHLFSWSDFIDFVTSRDCSGEALSSVNRMRPSEIYSYSVYDDPHDLTFSSDAEHEFTVGGVSMVRHDREMTVRLVGGRIADLAAESEKVHDLSGDHVPRFKRGLQPLGEPRAEPLGSYTDLWKIIAYIRFDIGSDSEDVRYVLVDSGNHYQVATNDEEVYDHVPREKRDEAIANARSQIVECAPLFELAKTCCYLPEYFSFRYVLVRDEQYESGPGRADLQHAVYRPAFIDTSSVTPEATDHVFKKVSALRVITTSDRPTFVRRFTSPQFRVAVRGFWREIDATSPGHGPNGEAVAGRTWVHEHDRWRDLPERPRAVLVKSRVAIARRIVEEEAAEVTMPMAAPCAEIAELGSVSRDEQYRQRKLLTRRLRWRILQRDDFRCRKCGADAATDRGVRLDVDHIRPIAAGGRTEPENLQTLCSACNGGKGELV